MTTTETARLWGIEASLGEAVQTAQELAQEYPLTAAALASVSLLAAGGVPVLVAAQCVALGAGIATTAFTSVAIAVALTPDAEEPKEETPPPSPAA